MPVNGGSGAIEVVGGEKVEQRTSEHRKCQAALSGSGGGPSAVRGLACGKDIKPVFDCLASETGPGPIGFCERASVGLRPQGQQRPVFPCGQPTPCCADDVGQVTRSPLASGTVQQGKLVGTGAREKGTHEPVFGAEQEQQHARARVDRPSQRPERHVRKAMLENVLVCELEELALAGRRGAWWLVHSASLSLKRLCQ